MVNLPTGPFQFLKGVKNNLTGADETVQNYPFVDHYQLILKQQTLANGLLTIQSSIATAANMYSAEITASTDTKNDTLLATTKYVKDRVALWSQDEAVSDVDLNNFAINKVKHVQFDNTLVKLDASDNNSLRINSNNVYGAPSASTPFTLGLLTQQSKIIFDTDGKMRFNTAKNVDGTWTSVVGPWVDNDGVLHANVANPELDLSGSAVNGVITWVCSSANVPMLPNQLGLPAIMFDSSATALNAQCTTMQLNGTAVKAITSILIPSDNDVLPADFIYTSTIFNASTTTSVYFNSEAMASAAGVVTSGSVKTLDGVFVNFAGIYQLGPESAASITLTRAKGMNGYIISIEALTTKTQAAVLNP